MPIANEAPAQPRHSLVRTLVTPVLVLAVIASVIGVIAIHILVHDNINANATETAQNTIRQFQVIRAYYSEKVISKVIADGTLRVDLGHADNPKIIPLPATFMQDLGTTLASDGIAINLYSPYPFPGRKNRTLDGFQTRAWDLLNKHPNSTLIERDESDGHPIVRVAIADKMETETCVACHNNHALSPKTDWQLGEVRGILEVGVDISKPVAQGTQLIAVLTLGTIVFCIIIGGFIVLRGRQISAPIHRLSVGLKELSTGDLRVLSQSEVTATRTTTSEVKNLIDAFANFKVAMRERETAQTMMTRNLESMVNTRTGDLNKALVVADQAKKIAESASRAKTDFLSSMSHELRTPLNAILGFGQLLESDPIEPLSPRQIEAVEQIISSGNHLLMLIDEILDLSQIESGKFPLTQETLCIEDVVEPCLTMVKPMGADFGIPVINNIDYNAFPMIDSDHTRARQVLLNLLSNAIKYNRKDGTVVLSASITNKQMVRISVADQGAGIPQSRYEELFVTFNRLGAERLHIEGTGIGLSLSKKIIEAMNGEIGFDSTEGQGSTFWLDFPIAQPASA